MLESAWNLRRTFTNLLYSSKATLYSPVHLLLKLRTLNELCLNYLLFCSATNDAHLKYHVTQLLSPQGGELDYFATNVCSNLVSL